MNDLERVRLDGMQLEFVTEQTDEICMQAILQNPYALQFVKNQTPEMCLEAVRIDGDTLEYVKNQTHEICLEAVRQCSYALEFVIDQTDDIIVESISDYNGNLQYLNKHDARIYNMLRPIFRQKDSSELYFEHSMIKILQWLDKFLDNSMFSNNEEIKEIRSEAKWICDFYTGK